MEVRLLGSVGVWERDREVAPVQPRQRAVLAALAVEAGRPVAVDTLLRRVWGETPPARARDALYVHITRLRRTLGRQRARLGKRAPWRVVTGGSARYIEALRRRWHVQERVSTPIAAVLRREDGVGVVTPAGTERFDHVVMACHSDDALRLLRDADARERSILGAIRYQGNDTVLHTDASLLPRRR
ncbi:winged helix-turn-helix domain-containing protein, partial [Actinosynnema sp.]|uniref:AfsR/SARP family transcriptional regulator n=1 Tax=Actinosynnema sp. TaxID=1872144 RepID=UPI003F83E5C3